MYSISKWIYAVVKSTAVHVKMMICVNISMIFNAQYTGRPKKLSRY